jgi:hypothetical protein
VYGQQLYGQQPLQVLVKNKGSGKTEPTAEGLEERLAAEDREGDEMVLGQRAERKYSMKSPAGVGVGGPDLAARCERQASVPPAAADWTDLNLGGQIGADEQVLNRLPLYFAS